jgi:hypothetical protein
MPIAPTNPLREALAFLGAVEVAGAQPCQHLAVCPSPDNCGFTRRFAYYFTPGEAWHVAGRAAILSLAGTIGREGGQWEAVSAKRMPRWWKPSQQFAWEVTGEQLGRYSEIVTSLEVARARERAGWKVRRITVDLESGTEIAA